MPFGHRGLSAVRRSFWVGKMTSLVGSGTTALLEAYGLEKGAYAGTFGVGDDSSV